MPRGKGCTMKGQVIILELSSKEDELYWVKLTEIKEKVSMRVTRKGESVPRGGVQWKNRLCPQLHQHIRDDFALAHTNHLKKNAHC